MIASALRVFRVAVTELRGSLRSRRALVVTLLFLAVAAMVMYGTISAFAAMEREVLTNLGLPGSENPGSVTTVLWKSKPFQHIIRRMVDDSLVFADISGRHPVVLAYAMFIFQIVPLLTLLVSAPRIAEDLRNGSARYWLVRVTRTEWSLGKFFGEAMTLAVAMVVGALSACVIVMFRLSCEDGVRLLLGLFDWSARAWVYAFGWLGLFMGVSHITRSSGKATALGILSMMGALAWPRLLSNLSDFMPWLAHLDVLVPQSVQPLLWRRSAPVFLGGVVHLTALSFLYLALGSAVFRRRDA